MNGTLYSDRNLAGAAAKDAKAKDGSTLSKNLASRTAAATVLEMLAGVYRDALKVRTGSGLPIVHADQAQAVQAIAARFGPAPLADILEQLSQYEQLLWRNVNPKIIWDNVVITLACAAPLRLQATL